MQKILNLTIKKKWFDMIKSGGKKSEYREIKDYWVRRLVYFKGNKDHNEINDFVHDLKNPLKNYNMVLDLFKDYGAFAKKFDTVKFVNGYSKDAPAIVIEFLDLRVGCGRPEWGASPNKYYFIIDLGRIR